MSVSETNWGCLPSELRTEILGWLPVLGAKCSLIVTVSRQWHSIIEPLNFAEISLTAARLSNPVSQEILSRKRSHVRYIWFRIELNEYGCRQCRNEIRERWGLNMVDNQAIVDAFQTLFTTLSDWEPRGDLVLDISVYSPSDNQHWFKYLTFYPETNFGQCGEQGMALVDDPAHGWAAGEQVLAPTHFAIEQTFKEIIGEGPFDEEEHEMQWWRSLPLVPVVGIMLLRQQTRRRWKPVALANMLTRFPNLKELCYEPWREWCKYQQIFTDTRTQSLIQALPSTPICKLTIFECADCPVIKVTNPALSREVARASLHLKTLSASFMVDACDFFATRQDENTWENLASLALTSRVLPEKADASVINNMLRDAGAAALKMPRLETMELWNGRKGVAMLFRYQRAQDRQSVTITVRGTFELTLGAAARDAWDIVADRHCHGRVTVQVSLIDPDVIRCHGDAIQQLGLSLEVIRPVSLRQMLRERRYRG